MKTLEIIDNDCAMFNTSMFGVPRCSGLEHMYCMHGNGECKFRKTKEQLDAQLAEAERRHTIMGLRGADRGNG